MPENINPEVPEEEIITSEESVVEEELNEEAADGFTPEELELLRRLIDKTAFHTTKYKSASKKEFKEMMRSEHVIAESSDSKIDTPQTRLRQDLAELNASAQAKRILTGKVVGARPVNPDSKISTILADVKFGNGTCNVYIPSYNFFNYKVSENTTAGEQDKIRKIMDDYVGAEIRFVVRSVEVASKTAYADRIQALDMDGYANYVKTTSTGKPRVSVGSIVQGKVTRVARTGVTVCALGSETTIKANKEENEVSWSYVPDCKQLFKVNDTVNCRVLAIKQEEVKKFNNSYTIVRTKLSIRQTTKNPIDEYFDMITEGSHYLSVVTGVFENTVFVKVKDVIDVAVSYPKFGELPERGQERPIRITEKVEKDGKKLIFGVFV